VGGLSPTPKSGGGLDPVLPKITPMVFYQLTETKTEKENFLAYKVTS